MAAGSHRLPMDALHFGPGHCCHWPEIFRGLYGIAASARASLTCHLSHLHRLESPEQCKFLAMSLKADTSGEESLPFQGKGSEHLIAGGLARYQQRRVHRYAAVNVLLLTWKDDDIGVAAEVEKLEYMFRDVFNFQTWKYQIPSEGSAATLNAFIAQAIRIYGNEECLLIVYYGGHGEESRNKSPCTWAA